MCRRLDKVRIGRILDKVRMGRRLEEFSEGDVRER